MEIRISLKSRKAKIRIYLNLNINKIQVVDIVILKQSLNKILLL
jgi:hypothetical protein